MKAKNEVPTQLELDFADYSEYHRSWGNQLCHSIGIPLIQISVLGLLSFVRLGPENLGGSPLFRVDLGSITWLAATLFYIRLNWKLALPFAGVSLATYFIGRVLPVPILIIFFVVGWILQLVGHARYEKRAPAFTKNIRHLLIGPLWVFAKFLKLRS